MYIGNFSPCPQFLKLLGQVLKMTDYLRLKLVSLEGEFYRNLRKEISNSVGDLTSRVLCRLRYGARQFICHNPTRKMFQSAKEGTKTIEDCFKCTFITILWTCPLKFPLYVLRPPRIWTFPFERSQCAFATALNGLCIFFHGLEHLFGWIVTIESVSSGA